MKLSVASWNILADVWSYQMRLLGRDDIEDEYLTENLHWDVRGKKIVEMIKTFEAEIVCLQEVEKFNFEGTLVPEMKKLGYEGLLQKEFSYIGCATFYRSDLFELVSFNSRSRAILTLLKTKEEVPKFVLVANVHFSSESTKVEDRFNQIRSVIQEIQKDLRKVNKMNEASIFICGDFNCSDDSGIHKMAYEGKLEKGYTTEEGVYNPKSEYQHPFLFKNSLKEIGFNLPFTFKGRNKLRIPPVDFILYNPSRVDVTGSKKLVSDETIEFLEKERSIPSEVIDFHSDHLPIQASFVLK